jgi:NagD protein
MRARHLSKHRSNIVRGFILDMDGTLAVGKPEGSGYLLLPGVADFIKELRSHGSPFVVFTNGTAQTPGRYAENLGAAGLELSPSEMMTPSSVAAEYLAAVGCRTVLVLGGEGVASPLAEAGIAIVRPGYPLPVKVDAIYIGWHPTFGLADIEAAVGAVSAGAPMYVSSDVPFFYSSKGRTLGISGMIGAAITKATGRHAAVMGKPSAIAARMAARRLGCTESQMAIVGDDPKLEMEMARLCGATGIGVISGLTDRSAWDALAPKQMAHHVVNRIDEIITRKVVRLEER